MLTFDCTRSWVYPSAGMSAGWYVLHRDTATRVHEDPFLRQRMAQARLSFEQKTAGTTPPLAVLEWTPVDVSLSQVGEDFWVAPAEWS